MFRRTRQLSPGFRPFFTGRSFAWMMALVAGLSFLSASDGLAQSDFGDYSGFGSASSLRNSNIRLGATVDAESSAQVNSLATGDDNHGSDDEDGVTLPVALRRGESNSIVVNFTNLTNSTVYLNAYIDYNQDGTLGSGEQIANNISIAKNTSNANRTINFTVPSGALLGNVGVRVRITTNSSPGPLGADGSGEVEDYLIPITTGLSVGNLVWNDTNDNGRYDSGERGINNVLVELWSPGNDNAIGGTGNNADTRVATTTTAGDGGYLFSGLTAGRYYVKIPTPPLSRVSSVIGPADNGFDNDNNGSQPGGSGTAAYSGVFQLSVGTEPGLILLLGGNVDDTIDFGFVSNVGAPFVCDNRFYIIQNVQTGGVWDTTLYYINDDQTLQPLFIYSGKKLNGLVAYGGYLYCVDQNGAHLYRINALGTLVDMGEIPGLPTSETDGQWGGGTSLTSGQMIINRYTFSNARTTLYTIDLGSATLVGSPLVTRYASTGNNTSGNFGDIVWDPLTDKVYGYNTNDSNNLGLHEINLTTGLCTRIASSYLSTFGSLTIDANGLAYGYGSQSSSTSQDTLYVFNRTNGVLNGSVTKVGSGPAVTNSDGAACPGAPPSMKIGNHVWLDANNNGLKDSGEPGINGVVVQLFLGGEDPLTASPVATTTTAAGGVYSFDDLSPGQYFIYIPTPPAAYPLSSTNTDTADNGEDNDDNGIQTAQGQPVRSPLISLVAGTEPTNDGDNDSNTNLTLDFGFLACPSITISGQPPAVIVNSPYSHTFTASGGSAPYTWSIASGTLPSGLSLSSSGVLSGTATSLSGGGAVAFRATDSVGCQASIAHNVVGTTNTDFGDYSPFPSASSIVNLNLRMGALVDTEASATSNTSATGDDINGSDDEDGVIMPPTLEQGAQSIIPITVTNTSGSAAYLNVWIDFNRNGSLSDAGEQVASNIVISNGTSNAVRNITINIPSGASLGATALRARLTSVSSPGPDGADGFGEVEDHATTLVQSMLDYGDFSGFGSASATVDASLRLGAQVDKENAATTNATATGDDLTGLDDEDGVLMPAGIEIGKNVTLPVTVVNDTGAPAYLHAWIDFNHDGVLNNATLDSGGERLEPARLITGVTKGGILREWWLGIAGSSISDLTSNGSYPSNPTGSDVRTSFEAPVDWADNMGQRMRGWVYPPVSGTYTFYIAGDDECRLLLSSDATPANAVAIASVPTWTSSRSWTSFSQQKSVAINLEVGKAYYIEAIMKEGGGGDNLAVAWERSGTSTGPVVIEGAHLAPWSASGPYLSTQDITFTVPMNASIGTQRGVRFRLSESAATLPTGAAGLGEVEDYTVEIQGPALDFGDWSGAADASSIASNNLRLGALVDTEFVSIRNATASGDDITDSDDEDGVSLPTTLNQGNSGTGGYTLTNTTGSIAYLNAWIDFNGNGSFTDSGEQIVTNNQVAHGTVNSLRNLNFSVPSNATPGVRGVRVRLTNVQNPGPTGAAGTGEVEDYVITVNCPLLSISPSSLTTPTIGFSYTQDFLANGGSGPYIFTVSSGNLPAGMNLTSSGRLTGPALNTNTVNFTITATDVNGCSITHAYTVTPVCPIIAVSPSSVPNPAVGSFYSQTFTASGGNAPYNFSLASGGLPPGLTLASNGVLSGTTTQAGPLTFTLRVVDAYGCSFTSQSHTITPSCPTVSISPSSMQTPIVGTSYNQTVSASGGSGSFTYTVSAGTLPAGLSLNSTSGQLSGIPTSNSPASFIIRATNTSGCSGTRAYSFTPSCPTLSINPSSLQNTTVGTSYSQTFSVSNGSQPYTYSISSGTFPPGLTLNTNTGAATGAVSQAGTYNFTLLVTDSYGCSISRNYTLTANCPNMSINPSSLPNVAAGASYNQTVSVSNGNQPYTYSISSGTFPPGLNLNTSTGSITGSVTQAGTYNFTVLVTDAFACTISQNYTLNATCSTITLSPSSLSAAKTGTAYNQTITASGGNTPYTYSISSGSLPDGLSLSSSGIITGTPTSTTTSSFIIRATDSGGCTGTRAYSLTPSCASISISTSSLPFAYINSSYSTTLVAASGISPYTWSLSSGSLPNGLSLSNAGDITGTPSAIGSSTFTVRAADANGCSATRSLTLTVKTLSLGNLVWLDSNNDGQKDSGENGVAGATVQLFTPGSDNAIGGSGNAADTQVGSSIVTTSTGAYLFSNLSPGNYYVKVTPPYGYTHTGGTPTTADNNVDGNNDGAQPGGPGTPLLSPIIALQPGTESITDGDTDADSNLTVDFGLWAPLGVGNRVFMDINGDGRMNPNEGIRNVFVQLFRAGDDVNTAEAVNAAITDEGGRYLMTDIDPGSYFLHLAAIQFENGGALRWAKPLTSVVPGDDDVGQNLLFNNNPVVNGASTAVFTLIPGQLAAGNAESGAEGMADDEGIDENTDLTYDLGLECLDCPEFSAQSMSMGLLNSESASAESSGPASTFASWQESQSLAGLNAPLDNPDADLYPNLLEYALGTDPADGSSGAGRFRLEIRPDTGMADVLISQPTAGRPDLFLTLETSTDAENWSPARISSETTFDPRGGQTQRYAQVDSTLFAGAARGLVRLKVTLDADLNGTPEATATTPAWMFSRETFPVGTRSFSMPLEQPELFAGRVLRREGEQSVHLEGLSGLVLETPTELDVLDGPHAGQRFILQTVNGSLITTEERLPADLTGARVALRPLWTLDRLLPAELFVSGTHEETADRMLHYDAVTNGFVSSWLSRAGWNFNQTSSSILRPGDAVLVQARTQDITILLAGQVPQVTRPLLPQAGTRFMGTHQVMEKSPLKLRLTAADGFTASPEPAQAARLRLWAGDGSTGASGYDSLYLSPTPSGSAWWREGDLTGTDLSDEDLLKSFQGLFLIQPR
jgi:hypothetical protein